MTPILVVDNTRRVVCRGHFSQDGPRIQAHLRFENVVPTPAPESREARAARTVADIDHQVRDRLAAVEARIRREVFWLRVQAAARAIGILLALVVAAWFLFFGVVWAVAKLFGFDL